MMSEGAALRTSAATLGTCAAEVAAWKPDSQIASELGDLAELLTCAAEGLVLDVARPPRLRLAAPLRPTVSQTSETKEGVQ